MEVQPNESSEPMENTDMELPEPEYTDPVEISIDGSLIGWIPEGDGLYPDYMDDDAIDFARSIREFIYANALSNGTIAATPEGPFFKADTTDLGAVVWAIDTLYGGELPIKVEGNAPSIEDLGLSAEDNFDEDGTEIIR